MENVQVKNIWKLRQLDEDFVKRWFDVAIEDMKWTEMITIDCGDCMHNSYAHWRDMIEKCLDTESDKYTGSFIDSRWLRFSNFHEDLQKMYGHDLEGYVLDEKLLTGDGNVYSPADAVFIPLAVQELVSVG